MVYCEKKCSFGGVIQLYMLIFAARFRGQDHLNSVVLRKENEL